MKFLKVDWCSYEAANHACKHWHYSKTIPVGKLVKVGAWEDGKFVGCVLFGRGANKGLSSQFSLQQTECVELVRIAMREHRTEVSKIVSIALKMLKKTQKIKLVVSFADTKQGHHGGIYQAGNWIYTGKTSAADEYLYKGKRWHGRAFRKSHGSHLNYIDKGLEIIKGSSKHRYIMPLCKKIRSQVEGMSKSYPKKRTKQATGGDHSSSGGAAPTSTLQHAKGLENDS